MLVFFFNTYFFRLSSEICAQNCFFLVLMLAHMLAFFRPLCSIYARFRLSAVCMYDHHIQQSMDQPGKVANPTRGQLNRENKYSPVPVRA